MLHNRLGESYLGCTCRSRVPVSYKNCLLEKKMMSYPFHVQFVRRGWRGRGRGGGVGVGRGTLGCCTLYIPTSKSFLKRFQETEPFHFRSSSIIDYLETFWQFIPGD